MPKQKRRSTPALRNQKSTSVGAQERERPIVVLFADIMGCSEVANHKDLAAYNNFLAEFHRMFRDVTEDHKTTWYLPNEQDYFKAIPQGDEGCLMIFVPSKGDRSGDVDTAINVALDLKRRWLLSDDNKHRITQGLLPTNLAIGIHLGMAYVNDDPDGSYRPEGYAINLTKRIEGRSREGHFTNIYVSEAAKNELHRLTEEPTYTFDKPRSFQPKGISRDVRVFELKHHFLPTDWTQIPGRPGRSRAAEFFFPARDEANLVKKAYEANPTNLWLAEEHIYLELQLGYATLKKAGEEENTKKLGKMYENALEVAMKFSNGELRDAGILTIAGFILGEIEEFDKEQRLYEDAIRLDPQYPEAHWYLAYSISMQLYLKLEKKKGLATLYADLMPDEMKSVDRIMELYTRAIELAPSQSWMHFFLACEQWRWANTKTERDESAKTLDHAATLNQDVLGYVAEEPYFKGIEEHPRIKTLLAGQKKGAA